MVVGLVRRLCVKEKKNENEKENHHTLLESFPRFSGFLPSMDPQEVRQAVQTFLSAFVSETLAARGLYPPSAFAPARVLGACARRARHPGLCAYVDKAAAALTVSGERERGTLAGARAVSLFFHGAPHEPRASRPSAAACPLSTPRAKPFRPASTLQQVGPGPTAA